MEVNRELLTRTAEWFEAHPEKYRFGWPWCIGGRIVRLAGGRFDKDGNLRPTRDDPREDVEGIFVRHTSVERRARRVAGLNAVQAAELFYGRHTPQTGGAGREAAQHIRRFLARLS